MHPTLPVASAESGHPTKIPVAASPRLEQFLLAIRLCPLSDFIACGTVREHKASI